MRAYHLRTSRLRPALTLLAMLSVAAGSAAQEGALSQLYAARPPAGSSFVRVVNPLPTSLRVRIADGPVQSIGAATPASSYAIVRGGRSFAVQVGGKPAATLDVRPDSFSTLVLRAEGAGYAFTTIDDTTDTQDALKAELRFYNLAAACASAQLVLSPAGTPVLRDVAAGASAARAVNPVRATVAGRCGEAASPALPLPPMQPGDHLSLFLTGSADKPALSAQPSRTDPFTR